MLYGDLIAVLAWLAFRVHENVYEMAIIMKRTSYFSGLSYTGSGEAYPVSL